MLLNKRHHLSLNGCKLPMPPFSGFDPEKKMGAALAAPIFDQASPVRRAR